MVNSFTPSKRDPSLLQRIAHRVDGEILIFQAPVEVLDNGDKVVMLQPILDLFPNTAALCRKDKRHVPFLTNQDDLLLVPVRVEYGHGETYFVVPSTGPPPSNPSLQQEQDQSNSAHTEHGRSSSRPYSHHSPETVVSAIAQETTIVDSPVPRLFVVLPDPKPRDWDDTSRPTLDALQHHPPRPYRLYFLCDCGPGVTFPRARSRPHSNRFSSYLPGSTRMQSDIDDDESIDLDNCIHIADQPGYDILNLRQFSDRFSAYTLMLLRAFQRGINATTPRGSIQQSKITLPPLSQRLYSDVLQPFTWEIEERVATAIETFETLSSLHRRHSNSDTAAAPTIDLHRLWEYVEGLRQDQENRVHSMRRMFVNDGTARWLCEAHYQASFGYVQDDRDMFLWRCQELLGDEGDLLLEAVDPTGALNGSSGSSGESGSGGSETQSQAVAFDYHKMHLRLTGSLDVRQIAQLKIALKRAYMVQQISLSMPLPNSLVLMAIVDLISDSSIGMWNVLFVTKEDDPTLAQRKVDAKTPSTVPPPYTSHESNGSSAQDDTLELSSPTALSSSNNNNSTNNNHNTTLHALHTLFVLGNIKSLRIPDLDARLYGTVSPSPCEFPHLRRLHLWGSNPLGQPSVPGAAAWASVRPGPLLKAFGHLTELRISGIYLGSRARTPQGHSLPTFAVPTAPLCEVVESLIYLPHLTALELSSCGLLKENCGLLSRSLAALENRMTYLDVHNNWIEDEGLAELLWAVGAHLFCLDARNCGFGNESAFALASVLQAHAQEVEEELKRGFCSQISTFRILKLEETYNPHLRLYPDTVSESNASTKPSSSMLRQTPPLAPHGRKYLIQALELLQPKELSLCLELGFQDSDFASAFAGMKNLESLERLQVSYSNFGPLALAAMLRTLRATSCRIREIGVQSTLLTLQQQQDAVHQILSI
ncbi:hypothetical protein BGX29_010866 [Mortierella sp. GBA35]|nr:hypothetical protein BGX29_010866 [Mortierella sp. GBA35]